MTHAGILGRAPRALRWAIVATWMGVIFYMSSRADSGNQSGWLTHLAFDALGWAPEPLSLAWWEHVLRKGSHFSEYAILGLLLAWSLPQPFGRRLLYAWLGATVYACTDELHQAFVPNRGPSPWDVGIDSSGAATSLGLGWAIARWRASR